MPIFSSPVTRQRQTHPHGRSAFAAALLASVVLLPLLGHRVLTAWDEGIYAELAREMLAAGRWQAWLVPHWNGGLWFEKPPLALWLMAASMRIFGLNAFAARLPSALAGIATVTVLHMWLRRQFGALPSWLGTVLLLASFGFQHAARAGETDSLLTLFCLVGLVGLAEVLAARPSGWLFFWAGLTLALLTKGAGALPLLLTPALLYASAPSRGPLFSVDRPAARQAQRWFFGGLLLFIVLAGAWPLAMGLHFGNPFWAEFLGLHTLTRATATLEGHATSPLFYLKVLLVSAPPFALLYPFASISAWQHRFSVTRPLLPFLFFGSLALCLFSAARTRLPHYIAPVYPCFSALTAVWLARLVQGSAPQKTRRSAGLLWATLAALFAVGALATSHARSQLHARRLPDGSITPDNRESATLLHAVLQQSQSLPAGPLLIWHHDPQTPFTTDAFYSHRLVQALPQPAYPAQSSSARYFEAPAIVESSLATPHLLLIDRDLVDHLPFSLRFRSLAIGTSQSVGIIEAREVVPGAH